MSTQPSNKNGPQPYLLDFERPINAIERELQHLEASATEAGSDLSAIEKKRAELNDALREVYGNLSAWEHVLVARHPRRPLLRDYLRLIADDFYELHGDKAYGDDRAILCGFARIARQRVMIVGHQKGRDTREKIEANFGCAHPEGYRKALKKMQLAAKFRVPIVCLIDTPGAYPGVGAEERGIAHAIAVNLMEISRLPVPIVAAVIGEGGSGGALGIAVADQVAVMEYAYYSVISPEGCAAILWKTGEQAPRAAQALCLTPGHLKKLGLIDAVIPEPLGAAHREPHVAARNLEAWIVQALREVRRPRIETLLRRRYERLRKLGTTYTSRQSAEAKSARPRGRRGLAASRSVAALDSSA
jgi:acetyl-CoA carboxylase carboxyl transferase subunit alpha